MSYANSLMLKLFILAYLIIPVSALAETSTKSELPCSPTQKQYLQEREFNTDEDTIVIWYPNWSEAIAFSYLAKVALEEKGYDVALKPIEPGPIYDLLSQGKGDVFLDAWLPHTHADYWEKYGDELEIIGTSFTDGQTGLAVPTYMDIDSISQLSHKVDLFDGKIIGIGNGSIMHKTTDMAIDAYDLDFKQIISSGPAMIHKLKKAYKKREPIAVTLWKPHYIWKEYNLKYLSDPKNIYTKDSCKIISRKDFSVDHPEVSGFLSKFTLTHEQLLDLIDMLYNSDESIIAARFWYEEHKDIIESWW